jgi:cysteinyl-tRNA synthetase
MSDLRLYNTLTRRKEPFTPIDPANIRVYVCGPTVYDFAHIGNARPVIVFDLLFRLLSHLYGAEQVTYVRNITDVDDKINARARQDFPDLPINEAIARVTSATTRQFHDDVRALGCLEPTHEPRATRHIGGMAAMIQTLIDRGHAYLAEGGEGMEALFDVSAMPDYGQLSKRRLGEQQAGARVAVETHKKNPADFVLWKESSGEEPGWEASFDENGRKTAIRGRPGWHIECSVMAKTHLGETFDIHGGGLDLIFPHHENEIAQSRCAHGSPVMANVWMHNGFLQVEGRKMAKSEGNFITIRDLLHTEKFGGRKWPGAVLRLAMLLTHYREPIDFSLARLEEADNILHRWKRVASALPAQQIAPRMNPRLLDDLDSPGAIAEISRETSAEVLVARATLLGFDLFAGALADEEALSRIDRRLTLLREKNYAEADRIRAELAEKGIQLMDYKDPETGERMTKWEIRN